MTTGTETKTFTRIQRIEILLISMLGAAFVWLLGSTLRFRTEGEEELIEHQRTGRPAIPCFWHNQILLAAYYFRFRNIVVITSRHFDGECISRIIRSLGFDCVRGSSSRGGVRALLELRKFLEENRVVAFTADGPVGPAYRMKSGPAWLSMKTGSPVLCFHVEPKSFWTLKSWDGFRIPKPFTKAAVRFASPLYFEPETDLEAATEVLQNEMDRLRREAARPDAFD